MSNPKRKKGWKDYHYDPVMNERKCRKCGRNFIAAIEHRYKVGSKYYCSWTCYNHRNDKEDIKLK